MIVWNSVRRSVLASLLTCVALATPVSVWAQAPAAPESHAKGDIVGDWQGTLQAGKALRAIVRFQMVDKGFTGKFYSIDQTPQPISLSGVAVDGSTVKFSVDAAGATYQGTMSADGNSIAGTWSQGPAALPLTLVRATKTTAWEIPGPAAPPKLMAATADPSFDVATIKPNETATSMQGLVIDGRKFRTRGSSLEDLMTFAFQVQTRQIVNAADWSSKDRYDIEGTPDTEGTPNTDQVRVMVQKLLADRFQLSFHKERKEMSAYVLTVAKTGSKLKETEMSGPLPGLGIGGAPNGLALRVMNGTMGNLAAFLQMLVLDRPVVNQTGLTGKYDLSVAFTPDDSQFNGKAPKVPLKEGVEPAPNLFEAMQQQLGLKLDAQKTQVDVIAIDHVQKPSAN